MPKDSRSVQRRIAAQKGLPAPQSDYDKVVEKIASLLVFYLYENLEIGIRTDETGDFTEVNNHDANFVQKILTTKVDKINTISDLIKKYLAGELVEK